MKKEYNNIESLVFSCLSGYNYYYVSLKRDDVLKAYHCKNDVEVDITLLTLPHMSQQMWNSYIMYPPQTNNVKWPIDVIEFKENKKTKYGLVFRKRAYPELQPLKKIIYDDRLLDWRREEIKKLIANLVKELLLLKKSGYIYHSFDIENNILYDPKNMDVYFRFSTSITKSDDNAYKIMKMLKDDISLDFIPPWDVGKNRPIEYVNAVSAYYSLAAVLFRLMIGRLPYQGSMMDGVGDLMNFNRDTDKETHDNMMRTYYANPIFIFDETDQSNSLGTFSNEQKFIERWESLDEKIRKIFHRVFSAGAPNAGFCTIEEWYESFCTLNNWKKYFEAEEV